MRTAREATCHDRKRGSESAQGERRQMRVVRGQEEIKSVRTAGEAVCEEGETLYIETEFIYEKLKKY